MMIDLMTTVDQGRLLKRNVTASMKLIHDMKNFSMTDKVRLSDTGGSRRMRMVGGKTMRREA
eukprot:9476271-Pyramimonas_sp.AAC.1